MLHRFFHTIFFLVLLVLCAMAPSVAVHAQTDSVTIIEAPEESVDEDSEMEHLLDSTGLDGIPVQLRTVPDSTVAGIRKDEAYWYANLAPEREQQQQQTNTTSTTPKRGWLRSIAWLIIIGIFVAILIWYLASSNIRLFRKPSSAITTGDEAIETEDIFSLPFDQEIRKAEDAGNFRLATRLLYLQVLKLLADKNLINYQHERTNRQYIYELADSPLYRPFFGLTRNFEFIWYGKMDISADTFGLVKKEFQSFKQQVAA
jgi:hypothetical protein